MNIKDKKKKPTDYPQLAFRISEKDKKLVTAKISKLHKRLNSGRKEQDWAITKNEIILQALVKGLELMDKE